MTGIKNLDQYEQHGDLLIKMDYYNSCIGDPDANDCWPWLGGKHNQGYGMCGAVRVKDHERIMATAHRLAWRIHTGQALDSKQVIVHTCPTFNPCCVNPAHLKLGTLSDRNIIMNQRGRRNSKGRRPSGVPLGRKMNRKYSYTEEEILWIRKASSDEILQRYPQVKTRSIASRFRHRFTHGYKWLVSPEDKEEK